MTHKNHVALVLTLIIIAIHGSPSISTDPSGIPDYFYTVYNKLYKLRLAGIDVNPLIEELNDALVNWQTGKITDSEFLGRLMEIDHKASILEEKTGEAKLITGLFTVLSISLLIITPALFYWLFPVLYLYIWFKIRRKWVVEK